MCSPIFRNSLTRSEDDDAKKQVKAVPDFHLYGASRLYERDRRRYDDIIDRTAAREIAYWFGKSLQNRAVRIRMGEALHEFIADISGRKVREYDRVHFTFYRRAGSFFVGDGRDKRRVRLQLSVEQKRQRDRKSVV